ncbi:hypothetical protein DYB35_006080 [Aphanomyces astaci]|uniref:PHD-type domain-containing protein n=2 Tax=Aphanomyces astaci TaxID=112090 RepID=A0A418CLD5_APHAT|nr:hypothetical protein DYB35_006080 [Aphanomyces astaci]
MYGYDVCRVVVPVVSLDNTVGLVPASKSVRTTDRIIRDTCRCKRKRSSHPSIDVSQTKPTAKEPAETIIHVTTTPSPPRGPSTRSATSTPSTSPAPSAPSSPVARPVLLPNGLTLLDLSNPPWTVMHPEAIHNRTQCEVCGKQGSLICCDRCPSVYHTDCLPRDHAITVDPWLCPSCLQTPFDQDKACRLCAGDTNLSQIILCDCCDDEYHLYCLNPPLAAVPDGDWFCPVCSSLGHTRRQCLKKKSQRGGGKPRPQFSYPSLLQETYEDLTILDRGAWMRPPGLGKQWTTDDVRKLTHAQTKTRLFRDKATGRARREAPSLTKLSQTANVLWFATKLPDPDARRRLLQLAYSTQLNAEFRIRLPMAERVAAMLRWRYIWPSSEFEVDVFMRLLRTWHEMEQTLHVRRPQLSPPPSPPHLPWGFGPHRRNNSMATARGGGGGGGVKERLQLGYDHPDRPKPADLDPQLVAKVALLRITSPMSVRSILNPF